MRLIWKFPLSELVLLGVGRRSPEHSRVPLPQPLQVRPAGEGWRQSSGGFPSSLGCGPLFARHRLRAQHEASRKGLRENGSPKAEFLCCQLLQINM